ncbi:MAG: PilZ domain-containing protein [Deltaproteobacteria bacterium]|nr:PilZ domain-containing protein [Deltaproteobacteria bacterium]
MTKREEKRAEPRVEIDKYYSVELAAPGTEFVYQFKTWNLSEHGLCILVKNDSDLLKRLTVGSVLKMQYYRVDLMKQRVRLKTELKHITKQEEGRFAGHTLVGLLILEKETPDK